MAGVPNKKENSSVFVFGTSASSTASTKTEEKLASTSSYSEPIRGVLISDAVDSDTEELQETTSSSPSDAVVTALETLELKATTKKPRKRAPRRSRSSKDASNDDRNSPRPPDVSSGRCRTQNSLPVSSPGFQVPGTNIHFGGSLSDPAQISHLVRAGFMNANSYEVALTRKEPLRPLLENGADPNKIHIMHPPLHLLLKHYGQNDSLLDDVAALIEYGADVNAYNLMNQTPLMLGLKYYKGNVVALVELLLKNGADPNLTNDWKENCLEMAHMLRNEKLVKLLKQYGAATPNNDEEGSK